MAAAPAAGSREGEAGRELQPEAYPPEHPAEQAAAAEEEDLWLPLGACRQAQGEEEEVVVVVVRERLRQSSSVEGGRAALVAEGVHLAAVVAEVRAHQTNPRSYAGCAEEAETVEEESQEAGPAAPPDGARPRKPSEERWRCCWRSQWRCVLLRHGVKVLSPDRGEGQQEIT